MSLHDKSNTIMP